MVKYIFVGKAASGKDWCQNLMIDKGFKPLKQFTTRPKRPNETGDEYHFVSKKMIEKMRDENKFVSLKKFKGWWYGLTLDELEKSDVGILSVGNINDLNNWYPDLLKFTTIIYLDIPMEIRRKRLKTRYSGGNQDDSVERRIEADEKDFENFNCFDIRFVHGDDVIRFINKITQ